MSLVAGMVLLQGCERRPIVRPTPQMEIEARFWVRVLLLANATECTVEIPASFRVLPADSDPASLTDYPVVEPLRTPTKLHLVGGKLRLGATPLPGNEIVFYPQRPHLFKLEGRDYRGRLKVSADADGQKLDLVNLVPLEPYLAGVVGEEMPDYWEPQALRAQAIAARTYCLFTKNRFGAHRRYDVRRTQSHQVYGGISAESAQTWDAVNSTCGQILIAPERMTEKGFADPQFGGLFPAYYSSACGGHTSDSKEVFGDSFGPLRGVACPYCQDIAPLGSFYWPMATFERATVTSQMVGRYPKLAALGEITEIVAVEERCFGSFSRLGRIRLTGSTGKTDTLRGEDLRLALDPSGSKIRSAACRIIPWGTGWAFVSGRGWGHGVGMCQHGAEGMARQGRDAANILEYYYPGAEIVNVY